MKISKKNKKKIAVAALAALAAVSGFAAASRGGIEPVDARVRVVGLSFRPSDGNGGRGRFPLPAKKWRRAGR